MTAAARRQNFATNDSDEGYVAWFRLPAVMGRGMHLRRQRLLPAIVLAVAFAVPASASAATPAADVLRTGLPNRNLTPGVLNPRVSAATIHRTICVRGWTSTIRPPSSYTTALKATQLATYRFADRSLSHYEEDHLVPLGLGGSPAAVANLWPEPHHIRIGLLDVGSYTKDAFEDHLIGEVCSGRMSLALAQRRMAVNWVYYWKAWKGASAASP
jgi:hypothetical protein